MDFSKMNAADILLDEDFEALKKTQFGIETPSI